MEGWFLRWSFNFLRVSILFYDSIFNSNYIILCILFSVYIGLQVLYAQTLTPIIVKIPRSAIITRWTYRKLTLLQKDTIASHKTLQKDEEDKDYVVKFDAQFSVILYFDI